MDRATYLGLELTQNLSWNSHVDKITSTANRTLGFIRRNLKYAPLPAKELAYKSFVRPQLEYCCSIWDPHQATIKNKIEMVQRRAARFVTKRYNNRSSVGDMLYNLGWDTLQERRRQIKMCLMYKIVNHQVSIDVTSYIKPSD